MLRWHYRHFSVANRPHMEFVYLFVPLSHLLKELIATDTDAVTMITRDLYRDASTGIMQICSCLAAEDEDTGFRGGSLLWLGQKCSWAAAVNKVRSDRHTKSQPQVICVTTYCCFCFLSLFNVAFSVPGKAWPCLTAQKKTYFILS